jgi:hypothetical protein
VPPSFYPQALCVHDGWHYRIVGPRRRATYVFGGVRLARTWKTWSNGEGSWHVWDPPYANGFQFLLGTWERAGGAASTWRSASPREQVYRAWRIVHGQDGGSWREWPNTSRACGLS